MENQQAREDLDEEEFSEVESVGGSPKSTLLSLTAHGMIEEIPAL